jgi:hypothetical protein
MITLVHSAECVNRQGLNGASPHATTHASCVYTNQKGMGQSIGNTLQDSFWSDRYAN